MLDNNGRLGRSKEKTSIKQSNWNRPTIRPDNQTRSLLGENKEKIVRKLQQMVNQVVHSTIRKSGKNSIAF